MKIEQEYLFVGMNKSEFKDKNGGPDVEYLKISCTHPTTKENYQFSADLSLEKRDVDLKLHKFVLDMQTYGKNTSLKVVDII